MNIEEMQELKKGDLIYRCIAHNETGYSYEWRKVVAMVDDDTIKVIDSDGEYELMDDYDMVEWFESKGEAFNYVINQLYAEKDELEDFIERLLKAHDSEGIW